MTVRNFAALFAISCQRAGILGRSPKLSTDAFRRPDRAQRSLFEWHCTCRGRPL